MSEKVSHEASIVMDQERSSSPGTVAGSTLRKRIGSPITNSRSSTSGL